MPNNNNPQNKPTQGDQDIQQTETVVLNGSSEIGKIVEKINGAQYILVALSSDPSVDELSAAMGLTVYLDRMGKRATAIYSGKTPAALEFLNPEDKFATTADTLQDFVIAINKDKADHLRYKVDGDYVKVYITPYGTRIAEEDLDFSYGDFNVDVVLALNVANGVDLDEALREYGRVMHEATVINITTGLPGKLGEIEWCDPSMSSISEIVSNLTYALGGEVGPEEATAFLSGIVAATDRFSKPNTTPATMEIASKLMYSGANQQMVSENITSEVDNMMSMSMETPKLESSIEENVDIEHVEDNSMMDDLKNAEQSLSDAGGEVVSNEHQPYIVNSDASEELPEPVAPVAAMEDFVPEPITAETEIASYGEPEVATPLAEEPQVTQLAAPEVVIPAPIDIDAETIGEPAESDYSAMMAQELMGASNPAAAMSPAISADETADINIDYGYSDGMQNGDILPPPPVMQMTDVNAGFIPTSEPVLSQPVVEPAESAPAPQVMEQPVAQPEVVPMPPESIPAMEMPVMPPSNPAPQAPAVPEAGFDPSAFHIPGM